MCLTFKHKKKFKEKINLNSVISLKRAFYIRYVYIGKAGHRKILFKSKIERTPTALTNLLVFLQCPL